MKRRLHEDITGERLNQINIRTLQNAVNDIVADVGMDLSERFIKGQFNRVLFDQLAAAMHEHGIDSTSENLQTVLSKKDPQQLDALIDDCAAEISAALSEYSSKIAKFIVTSRR